MKRNVYLIILTIITILCIIAGTCYHLVRFGISIAGGLPSIQTFMDAVTDWNDDDSSDNTESASSTKTVSSSQNLDAFTSIQADMNVMDLKVVSGDSYSIQYKASKKFVPEFEVKNNCLTIKQTQNVSFSTATRNAKCTVTVTVADSLDSVKIQSDVGDITLSDQTNTTFSLYADAGDIDLENCAFGKSTVETDAGDFDLKNCTFTALSLYADAGDIDLENCTFTNMDISTDAGDIDIDSKEDLSGYRIALDTSYGDVTVNHKKQRHSYSHDGNLSGHTLTVSTYAGDIDLNY